MAILTGDTRKPEHVPQQPTQRQVQPHKIVVQAEVHAPMEPLEPEVPIDPHKIDEPLDQGNPPPTLLNKKQMYQKNHCRYL